MERIRPETCKRSCAGARRARVQIWRALDPLGIRILAVAALLSVWLGGPAAAEVILRFLQTASSPPTFHGNRQLISVSGVIEVSDGATRFLIDQGSPNGAGPPLDLTGSGIDLIYFKFVVGTGSPLNSESIEAEASATRNDFTVHCPGGACPAPFWTVDLTGGPFGVTRQFGVTGQIDFNDTLSDFTSFFCIPSARALSTRTIWQGVPAPPQGSARLRERCDGFRSKRRSGFC